MNSLQSILLFAALTFILSSCNSQEDSIVSFSPDSIAFSQEFKDLSDAESLLFSFVSTHQVDLAAMDKVEAAYIATTGSQQVPAEIFEGIEGAVELHQLMVARSEAAKIVDRKFGYLSLSTTDRQAVKDAYRAENPFILPAVEMDEIIGSHKKY